MTTPTASLPTTRDRFPPSDLAALSVLSALLDLLAAGGVIGVMVIIVLDFLQHLGTRVPGAAVPYWQSLLVAGLILVTLLLPVLALMAGLSALARVRWQSQMASGLLALAGVLLGGAEAITFLLLLCARTAGF